MQSTSQRIFGEHFRISKSNQAQVLVNIELIYVCNGRISTKKL